MRRIRATILWALSLTLIACSADPEPPIRLGRESSAIVGGRAATPDERYATVVLLDAVEHFCSGILISDTVVLTAAHCLKIQNDATGLFDTERSANDIRVGVNTNDVADPDLKTHAVSALFTNTFNGELNSDPGDNPEGLGQADDMGVLILSEPVTEQTPVAILSSAQSDTAITTSTELLISGFGLSSADPQNADNGVLYLARVTVTRRNDFELLAGTEEPADSCLGDSGGPAYIETCEGLLVAGVTSRGVENNTAFCGEGGIWTLAPAYEHWVQDQALDAYQTAPSDFGSAERCAALEADEGGCTMSPHNSRSRRRPLGPLLLLLTAAMCARRRRSRRWPARA